MKKSPIKLIAMLLSVVLMLPNFTGAGALNENEVDDDLLTWEEVEEIGRLEDPATQAYNAMLHSWIDDTDTVIYPNNYGGSYIRNDYKLVVKLVSDDSTLQERILDAVPDPSVLIFEETDISRSELYELADSINTSENEKWHGAIVSYELSAVRVFVDSSTLENMPCAIEQNHIVFEEVSPSTMQAGTVDCPPGSMIYYGNSAGSVGWHGKYKFDGVHAQNCILTAGHVASGAKGKAIHANSPSGTTILGQVNSNSNLYNYNTYDTASYELIGGYSVQVFDGDYGFLRTDDTVNQTDKVATGAIAGQLKVNVPNNYEYPSNKTVYKSAGISGYISGTLETVAPSRIEIKNSLGYTSSVLCNGLQISPKSTTYFSRGGDSGATVYYYDGGSYYVLGIIHAGPDDSHLDKNLPSYITDFQSIVDNGFIPYPNN